MILAAAACAAGISYIFHDDEQSTNDEKVTISSTIIDKQGIVKYLFNQEQNRIISFINKYKLNQFQLPIKNNQQKIYSIFKKDFSIVFFWSIPLKAHLLQTSTKSCLFIENLNPFERYLIKISIGIQNDIRISHIPSEIILSNYDKYSYQQKNSFIFEEYDNTLDSLSYNPIINDNIIPIGIMKKKKFDEIDNENNQKRFCLDLNEKKLIENIHLCVENLSKILNQSCSNNKKQLITLQNSSSIISIMNNHNNNKQIIQNIYSKLFQHEENLNSDQFNFNNENNNRNLNEQLSDGIILYRGKQFGIALGEPMIRKDNKNENLSINSYHSINELNQLLSKTNCLLMRQYKIESIEDLIRLFLEQGQDYFTELMINLFKVNPFIVEQLNIILIKWAKQLT